MDGEYRASLAKRIGASVLVLGMLVALIYALRGYALDFFFSQIQPPQNEAELRDFVASVILVGGSALAFLLAALLYLSLTVKARAVAIARRMNKELLLSREQFRILYDSSPVPYMIVAPDGTIVNPNKAACEYFGLDQRKLTQVSFFDLVDEAEHDLIGLKERFQRSLDARQQELTLQTGDEKTRWALFSMHEIATAGAYPHMGLVSLVDITEQKRIDKAKTEFISLASHQLRTPLSTVKWNLDLLAQTELSEKQRHYWDKIYSGNERMIGLVKKLLNISRIQLGTLAVEWQKIDLNEVFERTLDEVAVQAQQHGVQLKRELPEQAIATTDAKLLQIVVENLLTNAIRYTPEGGTVTLSCTRDRANLTIRVSDTGIGIPKDVRDKIFSKLFRAPNARDMSAHGTGLGLYMTRQLVEALGGSISFDSREHAGTTFTVSLPAQHNSSA